MVKNDIYDELPSYAQALVRVAVERTGVPIIVRELELLGFDSMLKMTAGEAPVHELVYRPMYRDYLTHYLVGAAFKIRRMWDEEPEDRLLPVDSGSSRLPPAEEQELSRRLADEQPDIIAALSVSMHVGLVRQVTSMPIEIRLEREIAALLPEHWRAQHDYLKRQVKDLKPHFRREIEELVPERVYQAASAMNVVFAREASRIAGIELDRCFTTPQFASLAAELWRQLDAVEEPGFRGDRLVTDAWAETVGIRGSYEWRRLDEIR